MVIVRDMLAGKSKYGDFLASPEGITTNILADRLKRMEADGLVEKRPYQSKPVRYEYVLTESGKALHPTLVEISKWANANFAETWTPPDWFMKTP